MCSDGLVVSALDFYAEDWGFDSTLMLFFVNFFFLTFLKMTVIPEIKKIAKF